MNECGANANDGAGGSDGSHPTALVDLRVRILEEDHAELGARFAALEGVVFSLLRRLQELERASPHVDPVSRGIHPAEQIALPHAGFRPKASEHSGGSR